MTEKMMEEYRKLKSQVDKLRYGLREEKKPRSTAAVEVWREAIADIDKKMVALAKRFTYDEKQELGLLTPQQLDMSWEKSH